jgi:hypothetical protein
MMFTPSLWMMFLNISPSFRAAALKGMASLLPSCAAEADYFRFMIAGAAVSALVTGANSWILQLVHLMAYR